MSIGFIFWLIMLLCIISWIAHTWGGPPFGWANYGFIVLVFIMLFLLGWHDFGFIVHE